MLVLASIANQITVGNVFLCLFVLLSALELALIIWAVLWTALDVTRRTWGSMRQLLRLPAAYDAMRAERDQARAAFEAVTKISELRAEAARRMADFTRGCR